MYYRLFVDGIHLVTKVWVNMKQKKMEFMDRIILSKRAIIEAINNVLKNVFYIEFSRHILSNNFIGNLVAGLTAYSSLESKSFLKI